MAANNDTDSIESYSDTDTDTDSHSEMALRQTTKPKNSRPRISASGQTFATVIVGLAKKRFMVHEKLLIHHSDFFRAALTGKFKEAEEKVVKLEDAEPDVFEFFVHWLYYQRLPDRSFGDDEGLLKIWEDSDTQMPNANWFIDLYIFGDKYMAERLRFDTLNEFHRCLSDTDDSYLPDHVSIGKAFKHLDAASPLCRYLVEAYVCWTNPDKVSLEHYDCKLFLQGIWRRYYALKKLIPTSRCLNEFDICDFHDHNTKEERKACRRTRTKADKTVSGEDTE